MRDTIQGLWIGPKLSTMEQLSISSFLANGHPYHLYVYDAVKNIPRGTVVRDASEILPASAIFQYRQYETYSGFSNFFRYKLLLERGGWWADMDLICLKPLDFAEEYVFSSEMDKGVEVINCGAIKTPPGSEVMAYAWSECQSKDPKQITWGETGPRLMAQAVTALRLESYKKSYQVFCPFAWNEWRKVIEAEQNMRLDPSTHAIHLWNEIWRQEGMDKDARYEPGCLYEQLKREYLPHLFAAAPL